MTANLLRNVIGGVLSWLLPLAVTFIVTPLVVHGVGIEVYGIYVLALGYANAVASLTLAQGLVRELAAHPGPDAAAWRGRLVSSALALAAGVGLIGTIVLMFAVRPYAAASLAAGSSLTLGMSALRLASIAVPFLLLSQIARAVPQGMHRFDVAAALTAGAGLAMGIGSGILVRSGLGILSLLVWNVVVNALLLVVSIAILEPVVGVGLRRPSIDAMKKLARFGGMTTASQGITSVWLLVERAVLARYLGPEGVALFVVPILIAASLQSGVGSATVVVMPIASQLNAGDQRANLTRVYLRATKILALVVVFSFGTLAAASRPLLGLWLGPAFAAEAPVLQVVTLAFALNTMSAFAWSFSEGFNLPERNAIANLLWMTTGLLLLVVLVPRVGLIGAAWARAGAMCLVPIFIVRSERVLLGRFFGDAWAHIGRYLVPAGAALWVVLTVGLRVLPLNWLSFCAVCVTTTLAGLALLWRTAYFDEAERQWIVRRFQGVLGRPAATRPIDVTL